MKALKFATEASLWVALCCIAVDAAQFDGPRLQMDLFAMLGVLAVISIVREYRCTT